MGIALAGGGEDDGLGWVVVTGEDVDAADVDGVIGPEVGERDVGGSAGAEEVGGLPDTAAGPADVDGVSRGVGRIDGQAGDSSGVVAGADGGWTRGSPVAAGQRVGGVHREDAEIGGELVGDGLAEAGFDEWLLDRERPAVDVRRDAVGGVVDDGQFPDTLGVAHGRGQRGEADLHLGWVDPETQEEGVAGRGTAWGVASEEWSATVLDVGGGEVVDDGVCEVGASAGGEDLAEEGGPGAIGRDQDGCEVVIALGRDVELDGEDGLVADLGGGGDQEVIGEVEGEDAGAGSGGLAGDGVGVDVGNGADAVGAQWRARWW